jgi:hypothetical protein
MSCELSEAFDQQTMQAYCAPSASAHSITLSATPRPSFKPSLLSHVKWILAHQRLLANSSAQLWNTAASRGNRYPSTCDVAPSMHECPEGYAGWFGVVKVGVIVGSRCTGRAYQ